MITGAKSTLFVVLCTFPDKVSAEAAARTLVQEHLAACANILPGIESIYRWQGEVEQSSECLIIMKTMPETFPALKSRLRHLHPYQVPEIIALETVRAEPAYAAWVAESVQRPDDKAG